MARTLKLFNLKRQKEYLEERLGDLFDKSPLGNGDVSLPYRGYLYPETKSFLAQEGFAIDIVDDPSGLPLNIIHISDDVMLTDEELREAESIPHEIIVN